MGEEVERFEESWARYCKAKYCVALSSCTDALILTLTVVSNLTIVNPVITTPLTFYATTLAIIKTINLVKFKDVGETGNLPDSDFGNAIAVPVHLYGRPGNWSGKYVIEDAAQAHGLPLMGLAACHSFYPTKNLGAMGQAGAMVTNDEDLYKKVKEMRNYNERERFVHYGIQGGNFRIDEIQAAILNVKLPYLDGWNKARRAIALIYKYNLMDLSHIIQLPVGHPQHNYHIYAIRLKKRDELAKYLASQGIQTAIRYPVPMHLQPALKHLRYREGDFPNAERWAKENLSLPIYPEMPAEYAEYVAEKIRDWVVKENVK